MARRATRRPVPIVPEEWTAILNGFGCWVLVDSKGQNPLAHPDPLVRCQAVHLAARAPTMRDALELLAKRFEFFESPYGRDEAVLRIAFGEIALSKPSPEEYLRILDRRGQSDLDLAA